MQEQLNEFTKKKLQEYGLTVAELGYEPVKPGDNNDKPAQSSLKVDRTIFVKYFFLHHIYVYA